MNGVSPETMAAVLTLAGFLVIVWAWRRWGMLGGLAVAIVACIVLGAYVKPVRDLINSAAVVWKAPASAVQKLIN